jgi:hypothetical protein
MIDIWQGLECEGVITADPAAPWVVNVSSCNASMFIGPRAGNCSTTSPNATLPSQWTAQGYRQNQWGLNAAATFGLGIMLYQVLLGEGMFSSTKRLRYHWTEVVGAVTLMALLVLSLLQFMMFFSEDSSVEFDWHMVILTQIPVLFFVIAALLVYRDSIAELARSRATHATRWELGGQYAAFMSHYKQEAAADARQVKDKLVDMLGAPVFLDSDDLMDLRNLCHQVRSGRLSNMLVGLA